MIQLKVKKLHPCAIMPKYQTAGAACFDLHACDGASKRNVILPGGICVIGTGLSFEIPQSWCMKLYSRSSHGLKGIVLGNGTGIIDSDYRGEIKIILRNEGSEAFMVHAGDRIAQAMLLPVEQVGLVEVEELGETARGAGGFGSTGK